MGPVGGKSLTLALAIAEEADYDPAYAAITGPIHRWAKRIFDAQWGMGGKTMLYKVWAKELAHIGSAILQGTETEIFRLVRGQTTAWLATLWRLGWRSQAPWVILTGDGMTIDMREVPPIKVKMLARSQATAWVYRRMGTVTPALAPLRQGAEVEAIRRLLRSRSSAWTPAQKG